MGQRHAIQHGAFHVTTNVHWNIPWCTYPGVPEIIIDNIRMTRNFYGGKVYAFCILPNHFHMLVNPGNRGISTFVQSFKSHIVVETHEYLRSADTAASAGSPMQITKDIAISSLAMVRWKKGFFVRSISDDERQWANTMSYIQQNPVHHDLVKDIATYPWSSIHFPSIVDHRDWL